MIIEVKPLTEINQQAIHLLYQELGVINAVRFLKQFTVNTVQLSRNVPPLDI